MSEIASRKVVKLMKSPTLNLRTLNFLVADPNPFSAKIIQTILKNFGVYTVIDARDAESAEGIMNGNRIDVLMCDHRLPLVSDSRLVRNGGVDFIRSIRSNPSHPCRSIPMMLLATESKPTIIKAARDAGAHIVVGKPVAPAVLYDRLVWIAYRARKLVDLPGYYGPDRRFKFDGYVHGKGRRSDDLSQDQISAILNKARKEAI